MRDAVVLFLMQAGKGSEVVVPGKLYEYVRSGTPILGLFPEGEAPAIIRATRTGVVVQPSDVAAIKEQIREWYGLWLAGTSPTSPDWTEIRQYSRERQAAQLAELLDNIVR